MIHDLIIWPFWWVQCLQNFGTPSIHVATTTMVPANNMHVLMAPFGQLTTCIYILTPLPALVNFNKFGS
jgi:hypothetical protein